MTPETLLGAKIRFELDKAYEQGQLNRLVVDEVSLSLNSQLALTPGTCHRSAWRVEIYRQS